MDSTLDIWTITQNPSDHPGKFVARKHVIRAGETAVTEDHHIADTLEEVRQMLPRRGLIRLPRARGDDPVIVESWL
tara:strand:- start:2909 stop:3136 length:228 start_codon:yes stop_codon:yes gene_type:complete